MPDYVTATELAPHYRVAPQTVLAWQRRGWIPCVRAGRRPILFDPLEVEKALRERAARKKQGHESLRAGFSYGLPEKQEGVSE